MVQKVTLTAAEHVARATTEKCALHKLIALEERDAQTVSASSCPKQTNHPRQQTKSTKQVAAA
jgi:hypothetical protein